MVVDTHLDPSMEIYQNTPISYRINIRAKGVILRRIILMSPLSHMAEMDQIIRRLSCLDQWPVGSLQINWMNPKPKYTWWHSLGLGLTVVLPQGHNKVISMSQRGLISFK